MLNNLKKIVIRSSIGRALANERGGSLILVFGVMAILGILAGTIVVINRTQGGVASYVRWREIAFNAAEAGVDLSISRIPVSVDPFPTPPAIWDTLPNGALYKSGLPDSTPEPPKRAEDTTPIPGYSSKFAFYRYQIVSSGSAGNSCKTIEAGLRCGPLPSGTTY